MQFPDAHILRRLHDEMITMIGGAAGLRDEGLLESAVAKPVNIACYGAGDVIDAVCALSAGIIHNHAFIDGNKRTALLALKVGLAMNGYEFDAPEDEEVEAMVRLADGSLPEEVFVGWVRDHARYDQALARLAGIDAGIEDVPAVRGFAERLRAHAERGHAAAPESSAQAHPRTR